MSDNIEQKVIRTVAETLRIEATSISLESNSLMIWVQTA